MSENTDSSDSGSSSRSDSGSSLQPDPRPSAVKTKLAPAAGPSANDKENKTTNEKPKKASLSEPEESESNLDSSLPIKSLIKAKASPAKTKRKAEPSPIANAEKKVKKNNAKEKRKKTSSEAVNDLPPEVIPKPSLEKQKKPASTVDNPNGIDESKVNPFQRLWSEEDELLLLQGFLDFKQGKTEETLDMGDFLEFIKKSLHITVSTSQLSGKLRKLKKKFLDNAERQRDCKNPTFSKIHEKKSYDLSKLIWGDSIQVTKRESRVSEKHVQKKDNVDGMDDGGRKMSNVELVKKICEPLIIKYDVVNDPLILEGDLEKTHLELAAVTKLEELEAMRKKLKEEELVVYMKGLEFLKAKALVALEVIKSSKN
ncbi:hypothetical protein R6Q59_034878 [Mikania micrantha]